MRSDAAVIVRIGSQDSAQVRLAQDNYVVQTLTPDRSDQPFGKAILPGRSWCGRLVPDAHGALRRNRHLAIVLPGRDSQINSGSQRRGAVRFQGPSHRCIALTLSVNACLRGGVYRSPSRAFYIVFPKMEMPSSIFWKSALVSAHAGDRHGHC
jgi:hypothetical protein